MIAGAHGIAVEDFVIDSWADFHSAIDGLRKRFPAVTDNAEYLEHDKRWGGLPARFVYGLVFRGQTTHRQGEDGTCRPQLLPMALRPQRKPSWVHKGPPEAWNEVHKGQDLTIGETLTAADQEQRRRYFNALQDYARHILRMDEFCPGLDLTQGAFRMGPGLEELLDQIMLRSVVTTPHDCVLEGGAVFPSMRVLFEDLHHHDLESDPVLPIVPPEGRPYGIISVLAARYYDLFMQLNYQLRHVAIAILQHYGLPTRALDVTFDAQVALWFALHQAKPVDGAISYERNRQAGFVYVFWAPITKDWNQDGGESYFCRRDHGQGLYRLCDPYEPTLFVDLQHSMVAAQSDEATRAARQRAALLTGLVRRPDWPDSAYSQYVVARLVVNPALLDCEEGDRFRESYSTARLFPDRHEDKLLDCLMIAGLEGLEHYV